MAIVLEKELLREVRPFWADSSRRRGTSRADC